MSKALTAMPSANPSTTAGPPKPFSISFGSAKPKSTPASAPKKRPHSALADPDSDHEEETSGPQLVSAFDQSGAIVSNGGPTAEAPLVIRGEKNRDWREESRKRRRKNLLPAEVQAARSGQTGSGVAHLERDEVSKISGIQFVQRDIDGDTTMTELEAAQLIPEQPAPPPQSADDEALEALLGGEKKSTLEIPALEADDRNGYDPSLEPGYSDYANEDDRFKADVASRPDVPTLDEYANVPVDQFGAGLLRGMGWKDGEPVGKRRAGATAVNPAIIKERRPALLGIGAKEVPGGVGDEFGAWGKAAKGKRKTDLTYNPVLLQNSKTGEMLTEEELAKKMEEQKNKEKGEDDWRDRRNKNLRIDQERKGERRDKERLLLEDGRNCHRSEDRSRDSGRRRDRSRSRERRRRERSRDGERKRNRSRETGRDSERRKQDWSREGEGSRHSSSRRRSTSREASHHHSSSRRERSRSAERQYRRR